MTSHDMILLETHQAIASPFDPAGIGDHEISTPLRGHADGSSPTIAIVGGGFAGTVTAIRLIDNATRPTLIRIIEPRAELGRGLAFSTREPAHLMNGPAKLFSIHPERPEHFAQYLARYGREWNWRDPLAPDYANSFAPRSVYGAYVRGELARAIANAPPGVAAEHVVAAAHDIWCDDSKVRISLSNGRSATADHAVLALGIFQAQLDCARDSALLASGRYVQDPWNLEAYQAIPREGHVLLIGSGLTMLDAMVTLERRGFRGRYLSVSRRGFLVHPRREVPAWRDFLAESPLPATVSALLRTWRSELTAARDGRVDWQSLVIAIRPHVATLWMRASDAERRRFLRHLRPLWEIALHRAPPPSAHLLQRGRAEGWFVHRPGRLQKLRLAENGIAASILWRGQSTANTIIVDAAINCTGAQHSWQQIQDHPIVANLLRRGLVRPGPCAFGIDADMQGTPLDQEGDPSDFLSAVGASLRGVRWESSTIAELVQQATALAARLNAVIGSSAFMRQQRHVSAESAYA